ncbi:MAG: hypothetical protein AAFU63_07995 [Pseudomonadota bacterium]
MNKLFGLSALIFAFALPTLAAATTYKCTFKNLGRYNVIPPEVTIQVAPDGQSADVIERLAQRHTGGPVAAQFLRDSADMLQVRWRLNRVPNSDGQMANLRFNMNFRKTDQRAWMTFRASGFSNTDQGTGTCVVQ